MPKELEKEIHDCLVFLSERMTRQDIAEAIGTRKVSVGRWMRGGCIPHLHHRKKIQDLYFSKVYVQNGKTDCKFAEAGIFSAWVSLPTTSRKQLLAAMNAYDAAEAK